MKGEGARGGEAGWGDAKAISQRVHTDKVAIQIRCDTIQIHIKSAGTEPATRPIAMA